MENQDQINQLIEHLEKFDLVQAPSEKWQDRSSGILRVRASFENGQSFTLDIADRETIAKVNALFQTNLKRVFARTSEFRDLLNLKVGERYTIVVDSEIGLGVYAIQFKLDQIKVGRYAQYDNCVELIFKPKGKRNLRGLQFYGNKPFAVFPDWVNVNTDPFGPVDDSGPLSCRRSKYSSFDERYLTDAIRSSGVSPVYANLTPLRSKGGVR